MPEVAQQRFLMDESLSPYVARALKLVDYDVLTVSGAFPATIRVVDPNIINWCRDRNAIWVHADDRARKEHGMQIITTKIAFLWVYRPGGVMSAKDELRLLSYVLPDLIDKLEHHPKQRHYRASFHGEACRPRMRLEELDVVRGKIRRKTRRLRRKAKK